MSKQPSWSLVAAVLVGNVSCLALIFGSVAAWKYMDLPGFVALLMGVVGVTGMRFWTASNTKKESEAGDE